MAEYRKYSPDELSNAGSTFEAPETGIPRDPATFSREEIEKLGVDGYAKAKEAWAKWRSNPDTQRIEGVDTSDPGTLNQESGIREFEMPSDAEMTADEQAALAASKERIRQERLAEIRAGVMSAAERSEQEKAAERHEQFLKDAQTERDKYRKAA